MQRNFCDICDKEIGTLERGWRIAVASHGLGDADFEADVCGACGGEMIAGMQQALRQVADQKRFGDAIIVNNDTLTMN